MGPIVFFFFIWPYEEQHFPSWVNSTVRAYFQIAVTVHMFICDSNFHYFVFCNCLLIFFVLHQASTCIICSHLCQISVGVGWPCRAVLYFDCFVFCPWTQFLVGYMRMMLIMILIIENIKEIEMAH